MALSVFDDESHEPEPADVQKALGRSKACWDELVTHIRAEFAPLEITWGYTGARWGWSLRAKQKKRTVLYMTPCHRHFLVGLVLGEKAVRAARAAPLSATVLTRIDEAPRNPEGRGIRLEIRTKRDLDAVMQLAAIKMAT